MCFYSYRPDPALNQWPTYGDEWTISGYVTAFATKTEFVIQWYAAPGWFGKNLGAYISLTAPTDLEPNNLPYKFFGSDLQTFLELVVPLEQCENATCDSDFYVSVFLDSHASDTVVCGNDDKGNATDCHGDQSSWINSTTRLPVGTWGQTYVEITTCCCFDYSEIYSSFSFAEVSFETATLKRSDDAETTLTAALAELLHVPASSVLTLVENADGSYSAIVGFSNTASSTANTAVNQLASLKPADFQKVGLTAVVVNVDVDPALRSQYQDLLSLTIEELSISSAKSLSLFLALALLLLTAVW